MELSKWENISTTIDESGGLKDSATFDKTQKSKWENVAEQYDAQELQEKIKRGEVIKYADLPWGKVLKQAAGSLPEDAFNYYSDVLSAIYNIETTAPAIKNFALGAIRTNIERLKGPLPKVPENDNDISVSTYLAFEKEMSRKYGTMEGFKQQVAEHPYEVIDDVLTIFVPALKVGGFTKAAKIAALAEPVEATKNTIRGIAHGVMNIPKINKLPENLMRRAIKLADAIPWEKQERLLKLALADEVSLVFNKTQKLSTQIEEMNQIVNQWIGAADVYAKWANDPTKMMPLSKMFAGFDTMAKDLAERGFDDAPKVFENIKKKALKREGFLGRAELSPVEAQKLKVGLNEQLSKAYQDKINKTKLTPLENEYKMLINRNIRSFLEEIIPETQLSQFPKLSNKLIQRFFPGTKELSLKEINRLEGDLIELRHAIQDETQKLTKGSMIDFQVGQKTATFAFAGGAAARAFTDDPAKIGAVMAATGGAGFIFGTIDSSSRIKASIANYLNNLRTYGIKIKPTGAMVRLGLYQGQEIETARQKEIKIID